MQAERAADLKALVRNLEDGLASLYANEMFITMVLVPHRKTRKRFKPKQKAVAVETWFEFHHQSKCFEFEALYN